LPQVNKTGLDCEIYWCNVVRGGNYSLEKEICVYADVINQTVYINNTNTTTTDNTSSEVYKAELELLLGVNLSKGSVKDQLLNASMNYTDMQDQEVTKNITSKISNPLDEDETPKRSGIGLWIFLGIIALVIVVLLVNLLKNKPAKTDENTGRQLKKLQPMNDLTKDEQIRLLKRQITGESKVSPGSKKDIEEEKFDENLSE
jgi:hypothetical protein